MAQLLIGIDVGGTNTDGVLINPSKFQEENRGILAHHKTATTADVSSGISEALKKLFDDSVESRKDDVLAITIGTTHFLNAIIEQDTAKISRVAVIRLCGPYSHHSGPFSDFPAPLTKIIAGDIAYVDGGHRVDGWAIRPLDEDAVRDFARKAKENGQNAVAIIGMFAITDNSHERRAAEIVREVMPGSSIVISSDVSGIGFLARENATILNASIMDFAGKIISAFTRSIQKLGFTCPILLTQNDGTVLTSSEARKTPIRTFSSGPTNSMRGAAFLCSGELSKLQQSTMVLDVGGTTCDGGVLLPSGFPRQASAYSVIGGVRVNFSMPHVESIGLGGGSIVRVDGNEVIVGPESVGCDISTRSLVFGGDTVTTTDVTLARGSTVHIGTVPPSNFASHFSPEFHDRYQSTIKMKFENLIDRLRTSPDPVPVILVGGGSFIAPSELANASSVLRPPFYDVANAIGAAVGKLSASIERIESIAGVGKDGVLARLNDQVVENLVNKGAQKETISIVDIVSDPVPYVENTFSFFIKVVGDIDYTRVNFTEDYTVEDAPAAVFEKQSNDARDIEGQSISFEKYTPTVTKDREWLISETDLEFLRIGTYILGSGGGGTPYPTFLDLRNKLREGKVIRVISLHDAKKDGCYLPVGYAGSPTVADEQLKGDELLYASKSLFEYIGKEASGVFPLEIGGGNGLMGMLCGVGLDYPVIDTDLMARAYPTLSQVIPSAMNQGKFWKVASVSDGNGNEFVITNAQNDVYVERMMRSALTQIGCYVGAACTPLTAEELDSLTVHHSTSLAWRIGRSVSIAQQRADFANLSKYIIDSMGGDGIVGRKIFAGKIVSVERKMFMGYDFGEVVIEDEQKNKLRIPFKNENIVAELQYAGSEKWEYVCSVPDLISVCYADSGENCGTPDYRYGVMVFVIAVAPSNKWTSTEETLAVGGPKAFGPVFEHIQYKPIGNYVDTVSVIDEYAPR